MAAVTAPIAQLSQATACSARTARGMRTPTGDYMVCAGGHAAGDPHGAGFGNAGWFTWTDGSDGTAPLPQAARDAMARLELAFAAPHIVRVVTRYEVAAARYDELIAKPVSALKPAEVDAIGDAQQVIAESFGILAEAGRLDLIAPAETAARYRLAATHCRQLAEAADFDGCLDAQDEMAMCRCQLAQAGRLDLIEVAA
jgi:hypothetical protein